MASRFKALRDLITKNAPGRAEAIGQGMFGLGDEIGAGMQAGMAGLTGGDVKDTYRHALSENRDILDREQEDEPALSRALEIGASIPTSVLLPAGKIAQETAIGAKFGPKLFAGLKAAAKSGLLPGAVTGLGKSRAADVEGQAIDAGKGLVGGGLAGAGARFAGNAASYIPAVRRVLSKMGTGILNKEIDSAPASIPGPRADIPASAVRDYGAMTPEQVSVLGKAQGMQQGNIRRMMDEGRAALQSDVLDPDSGRVLIPMGNKHPITEEQLRHGDLALDRKTVEKLASGKKMLAPNVQENLRDDAIEEAGDTLKVGRNDSNTEGVANPLADLFDKTARRPRY